MALVRFFEIYDLIVKIDNLVLVTHQFMSMLILQVAVDVKAGKNI